MTKKAVWRKVELQLLEKPSVFALFAVKMLGWMARKNGVDWTKGTVPDDSGLARLIAEGREDQGLPTPRDE